jgi:ribonuclease D
MMDGRPTQTITDRESFDDLCRHLRSCDRFAFDTEFVTEDTYTPVLCLVQVATADRLAVIDPFEVHDLAEFWSVVAEPPGQVIAHAAEAEIRFCRQELGRPPAPLFDVQIAAGLVGHGYPLSYKNLVRRVIDQDVRGTETRTEWRRRPLTEKQMHYALEDVRYLFAVHDRLRGELDRLGRLSWAADEFRDQVAPSHSTAPEAYRRVSGVTSLGRRQLAVLRELAAWREAEAKRRNRPVRSVAADDVLMDLARRQPNDMRDLEMFRGMNRRNLRRVADELLAAVRKGLAVPDADCPSQLPRPDDSDRVRLLVSVLQTALAALCARESVPPTMVATTSDLATLVRGYTATGQIPNDSPLATGWRHQLCGRLLVELLDGKLCLSVCDLRAEIPISVERVHSTAS